MEPFHIKKIIGQSFAVKFDGELILLKAGTVLTIGDVFFVAEGKNAWFILQGGEQIDVLDQVYMLTTKGKVVLSTHANLAYIDKTTSLEKTNAEDTELENQEKPDNRPKLEVKTQELVQHGLTNPQAKTLILTRYQSYYEKLLNSEHPALYFKPQVYRIAEDANVNIEVSDLASNIAGAKFNDFIITDILFDEKDCDLSFDEEGFVISPNLAPAEEITIKISLTNGLQDTSGEMIFVVQPGESDSYLELIAHPISTGSLCEHYLVADLICHGFLRESLKYSILNDPNFYFFLIKNDQLLLTREGVEAILNQTLAIDKMQITIKAKDAEHKAQATVDIPITIDKPSSQSLTEHTLTTQEMTTQEVTVQPASQSIPAKIEQHTATIKVQPAQTIEEPEKDRQITQPETSKPQNAKQASLEQIFVPTLSANSKAQNDETEQALEGFFVAEKANQDAQIDVFEQPQKNMQLALALEKLADTSDDEVYFLFDQNSIKKERISSFMPMLDSINLTTELNLEKKEQIKKHLYIENNSAGAMTLNISYSGDGKINKQYVFDNLNVDQLAEIYEINITNLNNLQISHALIISMLKHTSLII